MHYHAVGEEITDARRARRLVLPEGPGAEAPRSARALQHLLRQRPATAALDIPPNAVTTTESFVTLKQNARIENFQAHMHLRGKGMSMEAIYPDGRREMLSQVTDFNFNWHNMYIYDDDVGAAAAEGHDPPLRSRGTTTPRRTSRTPIRISGWATAIARSTRWATRG